MTRQLILLRHAQALPAVSGQADAERGLTPAGIAQCAALAKRLTELKLDKILVSPALRTRETARLVSEGRGALEIENEIYDATAGKLAQIIQSLPDHCRRILLVAHNPGLSVLAQRLDEAAAGEMATACAISYLVDGDWRDLLEGICLLDWRFSP